MIEIRFLHILKDKNCFKYLISIYLELFEERKSLHDIPQATGTSMVNIRMYTAAAIFHSPYNLMRTVRWLQSGAAVNIRFPGTELRRGPTQLHSIQECRAWTTGTRSWRHYAPIPFWKTLLTTCGRKIVSWHHSKVRVYLGWSNKINKKKCCWCNFSLYPHNATKCCSLQNAHTSANN